MAEKQKSTKLQNAFPIPEHLSKRETHSSKYLAEQEKIMARVLEEGARRIRRSCERAVALGIIDEEGNLLRSEMPADMHPGLDRDFGG